MTLTWIRLRRRRTKSSIIWSRGSRALRLLHAIQDRPGNAQHVLDVPALPDGSVLSAVPAPSGARVPRLRA